MQTLFTPFDHVLKLFVFTLMIVACTACQQAQPDKRSVIEQKAIEPETGITSKAEPYEKKYQRPLIQQPELLKHQYDKGTRSPLVSQFIRRIYQDKQSQIWFGTVGDGACFYDGKTLTYLTRKEFLNGSSIQDIKEDRKGNLWFATSEGLILRRGQHYERLAEESGLGAKHIQSLLIDRSGKVWAGTSAGLFQYDPAISDSIHFREINFPEPIEKKEIRCLLEDQKGDIWFSPKRAGIYVLSHAGIPSKLKHLGLAQGLPVLDINYLLQDKKGIIWLATQGGGLCRYDPYRLTDGVQDILSFREEKGSNECWYLMEDSKNNLWVSKRGEIRCYSPSDLRNNLVTFEAYSSRHGLTNCCVQCIYEDQQGGIWIGSGEGLFFIKHTNTLITCQRKNCGHGDFQRNPEHLKTLAGACIQLTKDTLWPPLN